MYKTISAGSKKNVIITSLLTFLIAGYSIVSIFFVGKTLDYAYKGDSYNFYINLVITLSSTMLMILTRFVNARLKIKVSEEIKVNLREKIANNASLYIDKNLRVDSAKVASVMQKDVEVIVSSWMNSTQSLIDGLTILSGSIIILFIYSWIIALPLLGLGIISVLVPMLFSKRMSKEFMDYRSTIGKYSSELEIELTKTKFYRFINMTGELQRRIRGVNQEFESTQIKLFVKMNSTYIFLTIIALLSQVGSFIIAGILFHQNLVTIGVLISSTMIMGNLSGSIQTLTGAFPSYVQSRKLFKERIIATNIEVEDFEIKSIEFKNFNILLDNKPLYTKPLNINLQSGKKYLLSGTNGSGKSQLYKALIKRQNTEGDFLVNNVKPKDAWYYGKIWILGSKPEIFEGSIIDNVTLFEEKPNEAKVKDILSNLELELSSKDAPLLSEGQKQRIAVARALYFDTKWIFLDEAISGLEAKLALKSLKYIHSKVDTLCLTSHHEIIERGWFDEEISIVK